MQARPEKPREKMKKSRARPEKPRGKAKRISAGQEKDREEMKRMPAGQEKDREKMKRIPTGQEKDQEKVREYERDRRIGGSTEIPQPETVVKKIKFLAASEVFVTDREQPELEVTYENCQNISNAWSSSDAVNRVIERGQSRILSSDYEVSASGKGQVSIRIEEDYFVREGEGASLRRKV